MTVGIECLATDDPGRALELAHQLEQLNRERRAIEADMQFDALAALDAADPGDARTITLFNENWHQGVVGLVAARVKEKFHRPTIAFARAGERNLRGSGRSIEGVHLRDVLDLVTKAAPAMIDRFGGHAMAAGLSLAAEHYEGFARAFEAATRACSDAELFMRRIATDGPLSASEITLGLIEAIARQIWGQGFAPPLFDNEFAVVEQRLLKDAHLKLTLELGGNRFNAIWFRHTEPLPTRVRLAYRPAADEYQGLRRVTLFVEHAARQ
jgi:single-stranded-DNA-specific exonuclease